VRVDNWLTLDLGELSGREWKVLMKKLTFLDADQRVWEAFRKLPSKHAMRIPRGAWNLIPNRVIYEDERVAPPMPEFDFKLDLDATLPDGRSFEGQKDAVKQMLFQEQGLLILQSGSGKTIIALAFAAVCETKVLVLVHTEDILQQWIEYARTAIPMASIGVIRAEDFSIGDVTIATVQTFSKAVLMNRDLRSAFGAVILDEAHHAPAATFEHIMNQMKGKYRFGFTATDKRADGAHPYMKFVIGPVIVRHKFKSKVPLKVVPVKTNFKYGFRGAWDWGNLLNALITDRKRNRVIAMIAAEQVQEGHSVLVLSRRIEHLQLVYDDLADYVEDGEVEILTGQRSRAERLRILKNFRAGKVKCLLATQLADEALDVPILSRVMLTFPGKHDGRIIQQIGRGIREHPGKKDAIVFDFVDDRVGVLRKQWLRRKQTYNKLKITLAKERKF
jgi:superfamily II DNA or RNA helicase